METKEHYMSTDEKFEITKSPIRLQEIISKVEYPGAGAVLLFAGTVREWTHGKRTNFLSYEGYKPMALKELQRIADRVSAQWPGVDLAITHRLGDLAIGDVSVAIAVASPHRPQAYAASRFAIEELKRTIPIWKKEIYDDGIEWIEGCQIHETAWMEPNTNMEKHPHTNWDPQERYARQIRFPAIGDQGQNLLSQSRIAIVGVGALGGATANHLARSGVGFIRIIDRDVVVVSNLQRQTLFHERDAALGLPKAIAAKTHLEQINSSIKIEAMAQDLNAKNAEALLSDVDLILDGNDNFSTRYLINEVSQKHDIPWIYGAIVGDVGETSTFLPGQGPCFACLHPQLPEPGMLPTCETAGIIGPIVQLVASYQGAEAMKLLTKQFGKIRKSLLHLEMWDNFTQQEIKLPINSSCRVCGEGHFPYLQGEEGDSVTLLCGRDTVQVHPKETKKLDLNLLAKELSPLGSVRLSPYFLQFKKDPYQISIFPDGRVLVHGTSEESVARVLYSQYLGG
ncbi:ThiF family adenylyltransferase [Alteribacillus sp. JSM 102045]|uniref:ThiF family adenylyltransferase n=1 Tax=Alteribacillus sp. JSM 102045 TaxID=1562101 RepID=UPI0035BFEF9E